jgi:hypothetical protein
VHAERGDLREAIRVLEHAVELPECWLSTKADLKRYRAQHAPRLASCASVDALLRGDPISDVVRSIESAVLDETPELAKYLEACRLELAGSLAKAAEHLEVLVDHGPLAGDLAAILRWARLRERLGQVEEALQLIETRCLVDDGGRLGPWIEWLRIASSTSRTPPSTWLARLRAIDPVDAPSRGQPHCADLFWALESLEKTGSIRINCGGKDYVDAAGNLWGRDRSFLGGEAYDATRPPLKIDKDHELYYAHRIFWESFDAAAGYRIPLPCSSYAVTLRFCVSSPRAIPSRFGARLEGRQVLDVQDPVTTYGLGVPFEVRAEIEVNDGVLDFELTSITYIADVSAIEVRRL